MRHISRWGANIHDVNGYAKLLSALLMTLARLGLHLRGRGTGTAGEFIVFVGPSGCGKSTLLRMIAGLEDITGGTLEDRRRAVNDVPPSKRGIAMVFQSYALYPHMTVYDNMAFG
jgi:ABC-type sulfate/molybdate transport systems ATPase subunit